MPSVPWVVVVAETPSLAASIADLLESDGERVATIGDPGRELTRRLKDPDAPVRLVISASNGYACATARRWTNGEIQGVDLVVVGSRDPSLRSGARVHIVELPLAPDAFLQLVRGLLDRAPAPRLRPRRGSLPPGGRAAGRASRASGRSPLGRHRATLASQEPSGSAPLPGATPDRLAPP